LPVDVPTSIGVEVARGIRTPEFVRDHFLKVKVMEVDDDLVWKEKYEQLKAENEELRKTNDALQQHQKVLEAKIENFGKQFDEAQELKKQMAKLEKDAEAIAKIREGLVHLLPSAMDIAGPLGFEPGTSGPSEVLVVSEQPALIIQKKSQPLSLDASSLEGKITIVYAEGDLPKDKWFSVSDVTKAFQRHGWNQDPRTSLALDKFCQWGYFTKQMSGKRPDYRLKLTPEQAREKGLIKEVEVK